MTKLMAAVFPIIKGKEADWRKFLDELKGKRYNEYRELRKKQGIHELVFLQKTPMGEMVIVTAEGNDPEKAFEDFGKLNDETAKWMIEKIKDTHGVDMSKPMPGPMPKLAVDSKNEMKSGRMIAMAVPVTNGREHDFQKFVDDFNGRWYNDFTESRKRLKVHERVFHQVTPMGELAIVTLQGDNPEESFSKFSKGNDDFTRWFVKNVKENHDYDLTQPPPEGTMPELVLDSQKQYVTTEK
jgi:hypothetical protein